MKKTSLVVLALMACMLVACQKTEKVAETVVTTAEVTTVEAATIVDAQESEESDGEQIAVNKYTDIDFAQYKVPEELEGNKVKQYAEVAQVMENGSYEVYTFGGPFILLTDIDTKITGELVEGAYITFVDSGVATMSYPGQISQIFSIDVVDSTEVLEPYTSEISETVLEEEVILEDVIFTGEVKEINKSGTTIDYLVTTEAGDKIFHVEETLVKDTDIGIGSIIEAVTNGVETRSLPGQLSGIKSFKLYDQQ